MVAFGSLNRQSSPQQGSTPNKTKMSLILEALRYFAFRLSRLSFKLYQRSPQALLKKDPPAAQYIASYGLDQVVPCNTFRRQCVLCTCCSGVHSCRHCRAFGPLYCGPSRCQAGSCNSLEESVSMQAVCDCSGAATQDIISCSSHL